MTERRTKVYRGRQEQERDEAEAVAHGWRVVSRDSGRAGYTVVFERIDPYAPTTESRGGGGVRGITWLFLLWNIVLLGLIGYRVATGNYLEGTARQIFDSITGSTLMLGLIVVWLIGFVVLAFLWFRGRSND